MNQDALMQASASWWAMQSGHDGLLATITCVRKTSISVFRLIFRIGLSAEIQFVHTLTNLKTPDRNLGIVDLNLGTLV